jgi:septum site-determining protein MinD
VSSGKGGTGKTTTVAALASCLAALGYRTLAADFDAGLRNLDIALGMTDFAVYDLADVLDGTSPLDEVAAEHPKIPGLFFLPAPSFLSPEEIDPAKLETVIARAKESFDFVMLDAPAGIGAGFLLAARLCDAAIIVATEDAASERDASKTAEELRGAGIEDVRLIVNKTGNYKRQKLDELADGIGVRLIGAVRSDREVPFAADEETALVLHSGKGAARDYLDIARRLLGENIPLK